MLRVRIGFASGTFKVCLGLFGVDFAFTKGFFKFCLGDV